MNKYLTPAAHRMLKALRDGHDQYALTGGQHVWVDSTRYAYLTFQHLLRLCLISQDSFSKDVWELNEEGKRILQDEAYIPMIVRSLEKTMRC